MKEKINELNEKIIDKATNWAQEDKEDKEQIQNRAMIIAIAPVVIGVILGLFLIGLFSLMGL